MKKETKTEIMQFRTTPEEKKAIQQFAAEHNVSVSEFVRVAIQNYLATR